ncbi:hypothetical protein [Kutzneria kofuensis]|uniref:Uncharacterized protein n=1 Tax=Kutzneria kofuensis TaxID=103725 RepID=A0A7W9KC67_9PSEU|nr:hypothetical protein [Kutzneria kofuensis]MBB5889826.1 hypothetical protein [Kutzneria kofuensis]
MFDQARVSRDDNTRHRARTKIGAPGNGRKEMNRIRAAAGAFLRQLTGTNSDRDRLAILTRGVVTEIVEIPRKASHAVALSGVDAHLVSISTRRPAVRPAGGSAVARDDGRPADTTASGESPTR